MRKEKALRKEEEYLRLILASSYLTQFSIIGKRDLSLVYFLTTHKSPGLNYHPGREERAGRIEICLLSSPNLAPPALGKTSTSV